MPRLTPVLPAAIAAALALPASAAPDLEAGFRNPPPQARPHTWWHWMSGNVTREGITADLESMADAGFGGGLIFNLAGPHHHCDIPSGPAEYLGPVWLDRIKHAVSEAERLGLEFGMHNCAGWATTGGPWITPDLAMQKLVSSEVTVDGGRVINQKLPQPEVTLGHYLEIAVFGITKAEQGGSGCRHHAGVVDRAFDIPAICTPQVNHHAGEVLLDHRQQGADDLSAGALE